MKTKISRMVGQLTISFLILSMLVVISIGTVQASPSISIIPASTADLNKGDTFSVDVNVDPTGTSINGVEINLKFDPAVVQLDSVVIKSFLGSNPLEFVNEIDNTNGTLELAHTVKGGNPAVTAPGTYATLNFKVKGDAPAGTSTLDMTKAKLSNAAGNIPGVTPNDGTITVKSNGGGPSISIIPSSTTANRSDPFSVDVNVDPAGKSVNGVEINLKFDPAVVQLDSVAIKSFLGSNPLEFDNEIDNTNGTLKLAHTIKGGNPEVTAPGTYATLNFKVKSNAPVGTSTLDLTKAKLSNASGNIPGVTPNDGTITVNPGSTSSPTADGTMVWKFISVPYQLDNSTVAHVLNGIQYDGLFGFDPVNKVYIGGVTNFEPLKGYLIHANVSQDITNLAPKTGQPQVPPSIDIKRGWNLIGTSETTERDAESILGAIDPDYYSIWNFNVSTQSYDNVGENGKTGTIDSDRVGTDIFMMQPKVSYWVWANQDTSLPAYSP